MLTQGELHGEIFIARALVYASLAAPVITKNVWRPMMLLGWQKYEPKSPFRPLHNASHSAHTMSSHVGVLSTGPCAVPNETPCNADVPPSALL